MPSVKSGTFGEQAPGPLLDRGKISVLVILLAALALAGFAWWWNRYAGERSLKFWGPEAALIIRDAEHVELFELTPPPEEETASFETVTVPSPSGIRFARQLKNSKDVTGAPGLIHARTSLLQDHSFQWVEDDPQHSLRPEATRCTHAVRFAKDGEGAVTILFDFRENRLYCAETQKSILLAPKTLSGWKTYIRRYIAVENSQPKDSQPKVEPAKEAPAAGEK
jgi:hypothetical protein